MVSNNHSIVPKLSQTSPRCPQPRMAQVKLMDHQLAMMLRCIQVESTYSRPKTIRVSRPKDVLRPTEGLEDRDGGQQDESHGPKPIIGLMMDKPGVGKTFVMLAMIMADMERRILTKDSSLDLPTIIVVPGHIYHQWWQAMLHIFKTAPLQMPHDDEDTSNQDIGDTVRPYASVTWTKVRNAEECRDAVTLRADVILVHMACYDVFARALQDHAVTPRRVIIDEADGHQADQVITRMIPCNITWLVSCTLLEHVEECIVFKEDFRYTDRCIPSRLLPEVSCICNDDFVQESIVLSEPEERIVICRDELVDECICKSEGNPLSIDLCTFRGMVNALHDPFMNCPIYDMNEFTYRCISNGISEPLTKNRTRHCIVPYNAQVNVTTAVPEKEEYGTLYTVARPAAVYFGIPGDRSIYKDVDIPLTFMATKQMPRPDHKLASTNATTTKTTTVTEAIHTCIIESYEADVLSIESNSKKHALSDVIASIIMASASCRILVASMYETTLDLVCKVMDSHNIPWGRLNGGISEDTDELIEKTLLMYQDGSITTLLMNARDFGTGLNLQCTTDLVVMHAMPHKARTQLLGRAQRPGRESTLNVWYLTHTNEIVTGT